MEHLHYHLQRKKGKQKHSVTKCIIKHIYCKLQDASIKYLLYLLGVFVMVLRTEYTLFIHHINY